MDRLTSRTSRLSHPTKTLLRHLSDPDPRQSDRQPHTRTEIKNLLDLIRRTVLQHQLHQRTKSHLLPMIRPMSLLQHRQAIMHRMSRSKTSTLKAQARQKRIRLHHLLHSLTRHLSLHRKLRRVPILQQNIIRQPSQSQSRSRRKAPRHILRKSSPARLRLKTSRQSIPHPSHQQTSRCLRNDLRIHHHQIRILRQHQIRLKLPTLRINNRQRTTRRIRRSQRRNNPHRKLTKMSHRLRRIQSLTTTDPNDHRRPPLLSKLQHPLDLLLATLPAKNLFLHIDLLSLTTLLKSRHHLRKSSLTTQHKNLLTQKSQMRTHTSHHTRALNITRRRNQHFFHEKYLL